jgi:ABC-type transporter Mla subunit MlaD
MHAIIGTISQTFAQNRKNLQTFAQKLAKFAQNREHLQIFAQNIAKFRT